MGPGWTETQPAACLSSAHLVEEVDGGEDGEDGDGQGHVLCVCGGQCQRSGPIPSLPGPCPPLPGQIHPHFLKVHGHGSSAARCLTSPCFAWASDTEREGRAAT